MELLFKNATIIDPDGKYHLKVADLLVKNGMVVEIKKNIKAEKNFRILKNRHLAPGFVDVGTQICDPGYEHREDLESVSAAAAAGGFTTLLAQPNTNPYLQSKSEIRYLQSNSAALPVEVKAVGAVSVDTNGENITEMVDMHTAGAVAFTDGKKSVQSSGLMLRALQYVKAFDGIVMNQPHDKEIAGKGQMHEGYISTTLGLKGIPALAEETMVRRDLALAEYTDSRLHLSNISAKGTVKAIREAKKRGVKVTASVAIMNLVFTEDNLAGFNSNYKVLPPLREKSDRKALIKGLKNGTIDFISSNHTPWEAEHKELEFSYADFGVINLQTAFSLCTNYLSEFSLEELVRFWSTNPRRIFGLPQAHIEVGQKADISVFMPTEKYTFNGSDILSKSKNSPLIGQTLQGRITGIINKNQAVLSENS